MSGRLEVVNIADQLSDEIYGLCCDIGRLERENTTLHTQLADVTESMGRVEGRCAELRELCADMWRHAMQMGEFAEQYAFAGEFNQRMIKLGVEVSYT